MSLVSADTVFAAVDALDARGFADFFAPHGQVTFANGPAMVGPEAVEAGCAGFFGAIAGMSHAIVHEWTFGDDTIVELRVTYTRLDGGVVTIPVVSIWRSDADGRILDYKVYFDVAPVFSDIAAG